MKRVLACALFVAVVSLPVRSAEASSGSWGHLFLLLAVPLLYAPIAGFLIYDAAKGADPGRDSLIAEVAVGGALHVVNVAILAYEGREDELDRVSLGVVVPGLVLSSGMLAHGIGMLAAPPGASASPQALLRQPLQGTAAPLRGLSLAPTPGGMGLRWGARF